MHTDWKVDGQAMMVGGVGAMFLGQITGMPPVVNGAIAAVGVDYMQTKQFDTSKAVNGAGGAFVATALLSR